MNGRVTVLAANGRLTGSWLAAHAAGDTLATGTKRTREDVPCPLCGYQFEEGELGHPNPTLGSPSFNDAVSMSGSARDPICPGCNVVMTGRKYLLNLSKCVASLDGIWSIASNEDRAWWLVNPPSPPFVMVVGTAKQQHLFWRTPLARSRAAFPVRVGPHVGFVRRSLLREAHRLAPELLTLMEQRESTSSTRRPGSRSPTRQQAGHPFQRLDREMLDAHHGHLKQAAMAVLSTDSTPRRLNVFLELNPLECWALAALCNQKKPHESAPQPVAVPSRQLQPRSH